MQHVSTRTVRLVRTIASRHYHNHIIFHRPRVRSRRNRAADRKNLSRQKKNSVFEEEVMATINVDCSQLIGTFILYRSHSFIHLLLRKNFVQRMFSFLRFFASRRRFFFFNKKNTHKQFQQIGSRVDDWSQIHGHEIWNDCKYVHVKRKRV